MNLDSSASKALILHLPLVQVDLKNFASWEDSPEKMMMDMMSDPNAVRREDR